MRKFIRILCTSLVVFSLTLPLSACQEAEKPTETTNTASQSPKPVFGSFNLKDLEGNTVTDAIFAQADLTLVNIWGSYCSPCIEEIPDLGALAQEYQGTGFQIIGLLSDALDSSGSPAEDVLQTAKGIVEETGASYPHLIPDIEMMTGALAGIQYIPTTVFVDKNGAQVGKPLVGPRNKSQWKQEIDTRLEGLKR